MRPFTKQRSKEAKTQGRSQLLPSAGRISPVWPGATAASSRRFLPICPQLYSACVVFVVSAVCLSVCPSLVDDEFSRGSSTADDRCFHPRFFGFLVGCCSHTPACSTCRQTGTRLFVSTSSPFLSRCLHYCYAYLSLAPEKPSIPSRRGSHGLTYSTSCLRQCTAAVARG